MRVDVVALFAGDARRERSRRQRHGVACELAFPATMLLTLPTREVLAQGAAEGDVHELHPSARREDGQIARERRSHKRDLRRISPGINRSRFALRGIPVGPGIDVAAARQDERVDPVKRQRRISRQHASGRQHDRGGARPFHSLYIVIVQEERSTRPRSPPRLRTPHRQAHNRHRSAHRHSMTQLPRLPLGGREDRRGQRRRGNEPIRPATRSWAVSSANMAEAVESFDASGAAASSWGLRCWRGGLAPPISSRDRRPAGGPDAPEGDRHRRFSRATQPRRSASSPTPGDAIASVAATRC